MKSINHLYQLTDDTEKAFDQVNWTFLLNTLQKFRHKKGHYISQKTQSPQMESHQKVSHFTGAPGDTMPLKESRI